MAAFQWCVRADKSLTNKKIEHFNACGATFKVGLGKWFCLHARLHLEVGSDGWSVASLLKDRVYQRSKIWPST